MWDKYTLGYTKCADGVERCTGWWRVDEEEGIRINERGAIKPYNPEEDRYIEYGYSFEEVKEESGIFVEDSPYGWITPEGEWFGAWLLGHSKVAIYVFGTNEQCLERTHIKVSKDWEGALIAITRRDRLTDLQISTLREHGIDKVWNRNDIIWSDTDFEDLYEPELTANPTSIFK